jgi:transposase
MFIIGVDAHTRVHSAAVIDDHGRVLDMVEVGAKPDELDRLVAWAGSFSGPRLVAVEGAKGLGLALTRRLLTAGETVVDIATHLTALGRRSSRRRGKDDEIDAVTIARVALREADLPRLTIDQLDADLKLLVDARDQLVAEATRVRNRLHALLLVLAPGYRDDTGALSNRAGLATAKRLVLRGRAQEPVRAKLAVAAINRLHHLEREADDLEDDIKTAVTARQPTHLLKICGVGPVIAAKILGETRGVERFATAAAFAAHTGTAPLPASSGQTTRHRLNRGGNRQLNRALFTIAMVQARWSPHARAYLARKRAEGKSPAEARRCLKRHLAKTIYDAMRADARDAQIRAAA